MTLLRHLAAAVLAAVVVAVLTIQLNAFRDYQIAEIACYVVAVAGLTVLVGLSGQISLGNGALMAVGAYAAGLLLIHLQWPLAGVLAAATAITAARRGDRRRGRGPAARPVPGGRDPAAGGGAAVAGDQVRRGVRR